MAWMTMHIIPTYCAISSSIHREYSGAWSKPESPSALRGRQPMDTAGSSWIRQPLLTPNHMHYLGTESYNTFLI